MKIRWDFFFETHGFKFGRVHKYRGTIPSEHATRFGLHSGGVEFVFTVEPDAQCKFPAAEQSGMLRLLLPGRESETENIAMWLIGHLSEQISFHQNGGQLKVHGGLITGQHIPDTPEEAAELGDAPYFFQAHLIEAEETPVFDGSSLRKVTGDAAFVRATRQYNAALAAENPIDRFLGLFRILEDLFASRSKNRDVANALKDARDLYDIAYDKLTVPVGNVRRKPMREDFNELVDDFVGVRDHCAHLRSAQGLGIAHGDPRVESEVVPLLEPLRVLCVRSIQKLQADAMPTSRSRP